MLPNTNVYELKITPNSFAVCIEVSAFDRGETIEVRIDRKCGSEEFYIDSIQYRKDCNWIIYQNAPEDCPPDVHADWLESNYIGWDDLRRGEDRSRNTLEIKKERSLKQATSMGWTLEHWRLCEKALAYAKSLEIDFTRLLK